MKRIGIIISLALLLILGSVAIVLNTNWFQQKITNTVIRDFQNRTGASLTIDEVGFNFYNGLEINVIHLKDRQGKPILSAERMFVDIQLLPLLRQEIRFNTIRIIRANLFLTKKTSDGPLNIQFILDAYKSKKRAKKNWDFNFNTLLLRNCRVHYDLTSIPVVEGQFDPNHLDIQDVSAKMAFKGSSGVKYKFSITKFQAREKSGLHIDQLQLEGLYTETALKVSNFEVKSGNSNLMVKGLIAKYKRNRNLSQLIKNLQIQPVTLHLFILPSEFSFLNKAASKFSKPIKVDLLFEGNLSRLVCRNMNIDLSNMLTINGLFVVDNFFDLKKFQVNGDIKNFNVSPAGIDFLLNTFSNTKTDLSMLKKLGSVNYQGKFKGSSQQALLTGLFSTTIGDLTTDLQLNKDGKKLRYNGLLKSNSIHLSDVLPENSLLGETGFDFKLNGSIDPVSGLEGSVNGLASHLVYHGYDFQNLVVKGHFDRNGFDGYAALGDVNGNLRFSGLVNLTKEMPVYQFDLFADGFNPFAFGLLGYQSNASFSFHLHSNMTGHDFDDLTGNLILDSLQLKSGKEKFFLNKLNVDVARTVGNQSIKVSSPILNAELWGNFELSGLPAGFKGLLHRFLPSLVSSNFEMPKGSNYDFHASLAPCPELLSILKLPFNLIENVEVQGFYNEVNGKFRFRGDAPNLTYGKTIVKEAGFLLENPQKEAKFLAFAQLGPETSPIKLNLDARGLNDLASFKFNLSNVGLQTYSSNIQGDVQFSRAANGNLNLDGNLKKSSIIVNDSLWQINPTNLRWENKALYISDFQLTHADQFVKLQGIASDRMTDTLFVSMNAFSLDNVFDLFPKNNGGTVLLGGLVSGQAKCSRLLGTLSLDADLYVKQFTINKVLLGNLTAKSKWDTNLKAIVLDALVKKDSTLTEASNLVAKGTGYYFPSKDSMNLALDGHRLPISFLEPYLGTILKQIQGTATGKVHIAGPMKHLTINTKAFIENGSFGIDMLNTRYTFSDTILLTPKLVKFTNVRVRDKEGNSAIANGTIVHNNFKDSYTSIEIMGNNILAMDIPSNPNSYFYGKAYGTGTVSINGPQNDVRIDVNLRSEDRTNVTISFLNDTEVTEAGFIQFIQKKKVNNIEDADLFMRKRLTAPVINTPSNVTVNLYMEVTPNADLTLVTDPTTGDDIKAKGSGALRCVIDKSDDISLYGRYNILSGKYKFIYQNILRRDFNIQDGGSVTFAGNPFEAQVDITANYTVNAQLSDLLPTDVLSNLNLNRSSIPVNCVLKLNGELQRPGISLDLAYPSADADLELQIKNVINTEDMRNQQLVFLMLFSRFSTPAYSTAQATTTNNMSAVWNTGISTLSSQLNRMVNGVLGNNNMNFNFNYKNSAYDATTPGEWGVMMSGSFFNNRLSINSNVGSRENLGSSTGGNQFIGEFDGNLKFKNSEKWSWKFFNRANDNKYFKSALNTQGVGILYKEDFNSLLDLFKKPSISPGKNHPTK
ncbi:MAG TPA: translocation/assembly module TamB domain-containing protein [Bacteroidales bacterium]|nr:translocation/assembly module TamB domain-containing protein [Bacteroidales bacterium]